MFDTQPPKTGKLPPTLKNIIHSSKGKVEYIFCLEVLHLFLSNMHHQENTFFLECSSM